MCDYCENKDKGFYDLNETGDYSFINISISNMGYLRCRTYYNGNYDGAPPTQDVVEIKYCPMCGRRLKDGGLY